MGDVLCFVHATSRLRPNTVRSNPKDRRDNSASKIKKYSAGIIPLVFQLLTAGDPTPASAAADAVPPTASTISETEHSMRLDNSRIVKLSRVHVLPVEISSSVKCALWMAANMETAARLRQLEWVLQVEDKEIRESLGFESSDWSNKKSGLRGFDPYDALALANAYDLPMEWVYGGQIPHGTDPELRKRLAEGNRRAMAEIALRRA